MQYKEAVKLKKGDVIIERGRGTQLKVLCIREYEGYLGNPYAIVTCEDEYERIIKVYHKKVLKVVRENE